MTYDFSKVTQVELGSGAHDSAEEGLCFMEMAAWFAGEKHSDKPQCACPILGAYGISLNDNMPDDLRNEFLRPLVPLIVGTRDPKSEQKRAAFLAMWAVNKIAPLAPLALRASNLTKAAEACEQAKDLDAARAAACATYATARAAAYAADAARAAADAPAKRQVWEVAVEGLRQAIELGKHEPFASNIDWAARHEALRELVA